MEENFADTATEAGSTSNFNHDFTPENKNQSETRPPESTFEISSESNPDSMFSPGVENPSKNIEPDPNDKFEEESPTLKLEKEVTELKDKYIRLYAEFDNFKRRTSKERSDLFKTANKEVLVSLLPVLDDLERANKSFKDVKEIEPIKEGINLIMSKFKNIVAQQGITEIRSIGEKFDTDLHEAITNIPAPDNMKGKIIDEMEKGYLLNDKVIRFAKVIVGA